MFIGHFAPAFIAAAAYSRGPRLATYFVAAQLVDWAFFTLALFGIEEMRITPGITAMNAMDLYYYPYTHSLLSTGIWAIAFGLVVALWKRDALGGLVVALVVVSHWALDWVVHRPDLTIAGGEATYGLGLWNYPFVAIPVELVLTLGAFAFYLQRSRGPIGQPLIMTGILLAMQAIDWFGPPPVEAGALFYLQALLAFALATVLAGWTARHRNFPRRGGLAASGL
ncbi:MAG: hypothetical protein WA936_06280 [Erythrobacter sp.]|uniref:hypothetical protein n=1 Tax=Erythrobacter sp. TaxID=1042 RepID=UPI003C785F3A